MILTKFSLTKSRKAFIRSSSMIKLTIVRHVFMETPHIGIIKHGKQTPTQGGHRGTCPPPPKLWKKIFLLEKRTILGTKCTNAVFNFNFFSAPTMVAPLPHLSTSQLSILKTLIVGNGINVKYHLMTFRCLKIYKKWTFLAWNVNQKYKTFWHKMKQMVSLISIFFGANHGGAPAPFEYFTTKHLKKVDSRQWYEEEILNGLKMFENIQKIIILSWNVAQK